MLARELEDPESTPGACDCAKCAPHPYSKNEIEGVLRHLDERDAARLARGRLQLIGCEECADCGEWVPRFVDADAARGDSGAVVLTLPVSSPS